MKVAVDTTYILNIRDAPPANPRPPMRGILARKVVLPGKYPPPGPARKEGNTENTSRRGYRFRLNHPDGNWVEETARQVKRCTGSS